MASWRSWCVCWSRRACSAKRCSPWSNLPSPNCCWIDSRASSICNCAALAAVGSSSFIRPTASVTASSSSPFPHFRPGLAWAISLATAWIAALPCITGSCVCGEPGGGSPPESPPAPAGAPCGPGGAIPPPGGGAAAGGGTGGRGGGAAPGGGIGGGAPAPIGAGGPLAPGPGGGPGAGPGGGPPGGGIGCAPGMATLVSGQGGAPPPGAGLGWAGGFSQLSTACCARRAVCSSAIFR